jgi:outer membrane protein
MRAQAVRKIAVALALALASAVPAMAQQITRIAVVDLGRVIMTYSRDGAALKDFELRKAQIQSEIDRLGEELRKLQAQKLEADRVSDKAASLRLDGEIYRRTEYLKDFVRTKQAELDDQAKKVAASSQFVQTVFKQIQQICETEGFSLVLNLKSADSVMSSVVWYSPMIDITDKVIQALIGKAQ